MIREQIRCVGTLMPCTIDLEVRTLEDPNEGKVQCYIMPWG